MIDTTDHTPLDFTDVAYLQERMGYGHGPLWTRGSPLGKLVFDREPKPWYSFVSARVER